MISSRVKKNKYSELHQSFPALPLASLLYTLLFLSWYLQDSSNEASKNLCFPIYVFPVYETCNICTSSTRTRGDLPMIINIPEVARKLTYLCNELCYNVMAGGAARICTVN